MCVTMMMPASAGRVTYYLSDLKMAEAATADEAKQLLTAAGTPGPYRPSEGRHPLHEQDAQGRSALPRCLHCTR